MRRYVFMSILFFPGLTRKGTSAFVISSLIRRQTLATHRMTTSPHHTWTEGPAIHCILPLGENSHKGSSGRIGILGGSARYTGAPYYAGIASLQTGADLAYVFCADEAALAIKSYSPELMVAPVYNAKEFDDQVEQWGSSTDIPEGARQLKSNMVARVAEMLPRLHCLVIGPGMGRCPLVISAVADIIEEAKKHDLQLVLDADALYMLSLEPYRGILTNYRRAVLTPNAVEFKRLFPDDSTYDTALDSVIIVKKGRTDMVSLGPTKPLFECRERGGLKRSGGIGDILSGTIGTLAAWQILMKQDESLGMACWTACCAVKRATASAFESKQRSMTAPDVLNELGATFTKMTED